MHRPGARNRLFLAAALTAFLAGGLAARERAHAEEVAPGVIKGEVSTKPAKYQKGVVVYLEKVPGTFRPPAKPVEMDQKGMEFVPHVIAVVRGTTVRYKNNDAVRHNVFSPDGEKFDLGTWPKGESRDYTFKKSGSYRQLCNVHPEMLAYVVVLDNPHFAVTGEDGHFEIAGVPPGTYNLVAWSEKLATETQSITVTAGGTVDATITLAKKK